MSIVIHVGTHKTGTTSLQQFAAANRDRLRESGLWYPSYTEIGLFDHYAHHHLAFAICGRKDKRLRDADAERFIDHIVRERRPGEKVLISAEPLYRLTLGGGPEVNRWRSSAAAYWDAREAFLERLRKYFPSDDVQILICLRRQDNFARSVYQERVKVTKYRDSFATFLHKDRAIFDYYRQVSLLAGIFPDITVVTFERLVADGNLHRAFFETIGIELFDTEDFPMANVSLPVEYVEFKRLLNTTPIGADEAKRIGQELLALATSDRIKPDRNLDWLPFDDFAGFQGSFERDNEELRQKFLPDYPAPLFAPPAKSRKKVFDGLAAARAVEIASSFLSK